MQQGCFQGFNHNFCAWQLPATKWVKSDLIYDEIGYLTVVVSEDLIKFVLLWFPLHFLDMMNGCCYSIFLLPSTNPMKRIQISPSLSTVSLPHAVSGSQPQAHLFQLKQ